MSDVFKQLAEKLAAMTEKRRKETIGADAKEIAEMFAECQAEALCMHDSGPDERNMFDFDGEDLGPLPVWTDDGTRYCRTCGTHKRAESFDEGTGRCLACVGGPPKRRSKAA